MLFVRVDTSRTFRKKRFGEIVGTPSDSRRIGIVVVDPDDVGREVSGRTTKAEGLVTAPR